MVVIRLARSGAKKNPFYHLVVADKRARRDGRYIERLGYYNPVARGQAEKIQLDLERFEHWQSVGAKPSERVRTILKELKNPGKPARKLARAERKKAEKLA